MTGFLLFVTIKFKKSVLCGLEINVSFHIEDHEKAAIVGINGAGKTTLLRIIVGEMTPDDGQVVLAKDKTLGYLAQNSTVDTSHTIYEELLSVKADLLRLEEKIRECENNMKHADGDALEDLMKQYTSLTHAFETGGGYLYRSELVGVNAGQDRGHRKALRGPHGYEADSDAPDLKRQ